MITTYRKKIILVLNLYFLFAINACLADSSTVHDKEIRALYEKAIARYEKIERENAYTAQVNGIGMGYLDFGPKNNVPLIWAHGSNWTGYEILNVKDGLVAAGYRVIAIDYRGHGKTQIIDFNTSLYDVADDMAALMDHLSISKAVVGGWSKGGFVAAAFYDEYPERTLGLLLEDGGSWSDQQWRDEQPPTKEWLEMMKKISKDIDSLRYSSRFDAFQAVMGESDPSKTSIDLAVGILSKWLLTKEGKWKNHVSSSLMLGNFSGFELKAPSRLPLMQWNQQAMIPEIIFRNLHVPVIIIDPVSEDENMSLSHQNKKLQRQHPDLIMHQVYKDTGHGAHLERPERFIENAKQLLQRVKMLTEGS